MDGQPTEAATPVARLRGMPDYSGAALQRRRRLGRRLAALFAGYGYRELDTPLLEPTELFLRKSGGELASQLFSFTDPGSRAVSLRPEFTAPVMRHYLERAGEVDLPARWHYCGPVFRFDGAALPFDGLKSPSTGDPPGAGAGNRGGGQFTQIGGELLGAASPMADVELLALAMSALSESGLRGWTLRLADLNILNSLLAPLGLSERARAFVAQNVPQLREGPAAIARLMDDARRLHVIGRAADDDYLRQAVHGLNDAEARNVLLGVLRSNPLDQLGQRRPEEVVARLLRKIRRPDAAESLRLALESAGQLAQVAGEPPAAIAQASAALRQAGADAASVQRLEQIIDMLPRRDKDSGAADASSGRIALDFGLVRGLAYYNGIIFEVSHPDWPGTLGGGGRYDGLARDLGGLQRLPALGFAYNLDALAELSAGVSPDAVPRPAGVLVVAAHPAAGAAALNAATELRAGGETVEMEVTGRTPPEAIAYAARRGFSHVVVADEHGAVTTYDAGASG